MWPLESKGRQGTNCWEKPRTEMEREKIPLRFFSKGMLGTKVGGPGSCLWFPIHDQGKCPSTASFDGRAAGDKDFPALVKTAMTGD